MKAKPELDIQFGAGGDTATEALESTGTSDPSKVVQLGKRFIDAGVERMMIGSEGITENVKSWRTDVIQTIMKELPREKVMFEGECLVLKPMTRTLFCRVSWRIANKSCAVSCRTSSIQLVYSGVWH